MVNTKPENSKLFEILYYFASAFLTQEAFS